MVVLSQVAELYSDLFRHIDSTHQYLVFGQVQQTDNTTNTTVSEPYTQVSSSQQAKSENARLNRVKVWRKGMSAQGDVFGADGGAVEF